MSLLDPSLAMQAAVYTALSAPGALLSGGASVPVYDRVPNAAAFPYVVIGDDDIVDESADAYEGSQVTVTVHVWSRAVGKVEAKSIAGQVRLGLSTELDLSAGGFRCVIHLFERQMILDDPDGITRHGVVKVRYQVEPTE